MPRHNIFHNLHNITCGQHIVIHESLALSLTTKSAKSLALALALQVKSLLTSLVLGGAGIHNVNYRYC